MHIKMFKLGSKGDTILEVLIAVSVLSLILTSSFALSNRSSIANRQAAERGEASKLVQSEIEKLKFYLTSPGLPLPANNTYFCVNTSNPLAPTLTTVSITPGTLDTAYNGINAQCKKGIDSRYAIFIYRGSVGAQQDTYTTYARWDSATGRGVDRVDTVNRIYPVQGIGL